MAFWITPTTQPVEINGLNVPEVLLSGDHASIAKWRMQQSLKNTWQTRPDLLKIAILSGEQRKLLDEVLTHQNSTAKPYNREE